MAEEISVVITAYNKEKYINEAINSVLNQSFNNFELIIINDGSTDKTAELINKLDDKRIRVFHQENLGIAKARNKGIELSRGKYIAYLDGDDVWHKDKLLYQYKKIAQSDELCLVSCFALLVDSEGKIQHIRIGDDLNGHVYDSVLRKNGIPSASAPLVLKDRLVEAGGFVSDYDGSEDYEMWVKLANKYKFFTLKKDLLGYRRNDSSISRDYEKIMNNALSITGKYGNEPKKYFGFKSYTLAAMSFMDNNYDQSRKFLKNYFSLISANNWSLKSIILSCLLLCEKIMPEGIFNALFLNYLPKIVLGIPVGKRFN